jgi:hypothetical protein
MAVEISSSLKLSDEPIGLSQHMANSAFLVEGFMWMKKFPFVGKFQLPCAEVGSPWLLSLARG